MHLRCTNVPRVPIFFSWHLIKTNDYYFIYSNRSEGEKLGVSDGAARCSAFTLKSNIICFSNNLSRSCTDERSQDHFLKVSLSIWDYYGLKNIKSISRSHSFIVSLSFFFNKTSASQLVTTLSYFSCA